MLRHPTDEQLMDAVEGTAEVRVRDHLEACAACRVRVEQARGGLRMARQADVPEPSPFYWNAFRRQVGRRLQAAPVTLWHWRPALVAAAVVLLLVAIFPRPVTSPSASPPPLPAWSALPRAEEDAGLDVLRAVAPAVDDIGLVGECQDVSQCLADLSDDESRAFAEVFQREMEGTQL